MRNMTAQIFEYLLAARNSNLPINYDLNRNSTYWFLDEILSLKSNRLVENGDYEPPYVEISRPNLGINKVEVSSLLSEVFKLLQYDPTGDERLNITSDELAEIISLEYDALNQKILSKDKELIILNDWQQLLLGVATPKVPIDVAISRLNEHNDLLQILVNEYIDWQINNEKANNEQQDIIKAQQLYDHLVSLNRDPKANQQLYLGIGILHIPSDPFIYYPVLTLKISIDPNNSEGVCRLRISHSPLNIDAILDHVLFYDLDEVDQLKNDIKHNKITAFNDELITDVLKKIIALIDPLGKYLSSPVDLANISDDKPKLLNRSVLFFKSDKADKIANRLKMTANHLNNNAKPSDVLGSIVDPQYLTSQNQDATFLQAELNQYLFPMPATDAEANILRLLDEQSAIAVYEADKINKFPIISNLITHMMGHEKRILILAEDVNEIDEARKYLPSYLNGLHTVVSHERHYITLMKESLHALLGQAKNRNITQPTSQIIENIEKTKIKLDEVKKQLVDYRELSSKKFFWKDKRYFPYELAQLVSKLGGYDHLTGDVIPINAKFKMKSTEIEKLWAFKSYFTRENMDLLNYDFIDIDELMKYHEYQKLLIAEEKYLQLCSEHTDLESMFDDETDLRFVQYLFEQLPKLRKSVDEISDHYGELILKEAMISLDRHHELTASVDVINRAIEDISYLNGDDELRDALIEKLNRLLHIQRSEIPISDLGNMAALRSFYVNKKASMTKALNTAHLIWVFNEGAVALSKRFIGISAEGIDIMNILYDAAAIRLSKVEVNIIWSRVRSHFIRMYEPLMQQENIHPLCVDLYEALKNNNFSDFKAVLRELNDKIMARHNFTIFGNFIKELRQLMPNFTTKLMADIDTEMDTLPDFKAAFEQGKLNGLFDQLKRYESELLEQKHIDLETYKTKLEHELIQKECWKHEQSINLKDVLELINILDESSFNNSHDLKRIFSSFQTVFIPLNQQSILEKIEANQFDIVIFLDATSSSVFRLPELMHANKAVLFGNSKDKLELKEVVQATGLKKLSNKYGQVLHNFGEQYLGLSLFELVAHSAAWDARLTPIKSALLPLINGFECEAKKDVNKCDNAVEEEIFEALIKLGYDIKCKVKVGSVLLDFLIEGKDHSLAVNVMGDKQMQRKMINKQLEQELALKNQGINIYTIVAPNYYLDPRKTLLTVYEKLEALNIYPIK